ncbi:MAG: hypothetical protein GF408_02160 [Candidatus Omnitrophica bacterium]|nr:hypothetical protein [Candidatus Omnitrophota bacterium]
MKFKFVIYICVLWVVLEGAFRKWISPSMGNIFYITKYFLVGVAFLFYKLDKKKIKDHEVISRLSVPAFIKLLVAGLAVIAFFQMFNPNLPSVFIGAFGLAQYCWFILLIFMVPCIFADEHQLERFVLFNILIFVPVGILGVVQFFSPQAAYINKYVVDTANVVGVMGHPRITGTFSYLGGYAVYLTFAGFLSLAFFSTKRNIFKVIMVSAVFIFIVSNSMMNGSRGTVAYLVTGGILCLGRIFLKDIGGMIKIALVAGIAVLFAAFYMPSLVEDSRELLETSYEIIEERGTRDLGERVEEIMRPLSYISWYGYGTGMTQNIMKIEGYKNETVLWDEGYEGEPKRVMLELGLVGFLFYYFLKIGVIVSAFRVYRRTKNERLRCFSFALFLFILFNLHSPVVFNHILNFYFWLTAGLVFSIPYLDHTIGAQEKVGGEPA